MSREKRYTPGPWVGEKDRGVYAGGLLNPVFETGCGCCTKKDLSEADAHLIAAAPDLLEALEECQRQLDKCGYHLSVQGQIERAIAKAYGEDQ